MKALLSFLPFHPKSCWYVSALAALLFGLFTDHAALAQGPLTLQAIAFTDAGRQAEAEAVIKEALTGQESNDAMTWYVQGFVLKELYVADGKQPEDPRRSRAVESVQRCLRMDRTKRLEDWWRPLLFFLGESYLADVQLEIRNLLPGQPVKAEQFFSQYSAIQEALNPGEDTDAEWVLMQQQLGETAMTEAQDLERKGAGPWFSLGTQHYTLAATRSHDKYRSLFNLAVHTYNQGVREFKEAEDDLDAVDSALEEASRHWLVASTLLESAIAEDDTQSDGFEALAIVSTALLNQDRIEWCKAHIQELEGH